MSWNLDVLSSMEGPLAWVVALSAAIGLTVLMRLLLRAGARRLRKWSDRTETPWDDIIASCLERTKSGVVFIFIFAPLATAVNDGKSIASAARGLMIVAACFQVIVWGLCAVQEWRIRVLTRRVETNGASSSALGLISTTTQFLLIVFVVLIGLSNLGVDIGALITGLGIGGIAVALAAQNVLGDLLASLSIVLDKPFVIGDYIIAGNDQGTVENIGVKTTRVRSLSGEELIFANKDLLESRVRNYKRMWERRVVQNFSVSMDTPIEKIKQVPRWVKEAVERRPKLRFDRCHFTGFSDSALAFEFVFWVKDPDYNAYMDLQESLLLELLERIEAENIEIGFPRQTLRWRIDGDPSPSFAGIPREPSGHA